MEVLAMVTDVPLQVLRGHPMSAELQAMGEVAIRITADFQRFARALGRLNADLRKFNKQTDIYDRRTRRAERQANRRPALIHNGGKP